MIRTEPDGARSDSLSSSPTNNATVAELGDAQDLGSCGATRGGSSPSGRIAASCKDVAHPGPWHSSTRPVTSPFQPDPRVSPMRRALGITAAVVLTTPTAVPAAAAAQE